MHVIMHLSQLTWVAILAIPDSARSAPLHRQPEEEQQAPSSLCTASPDSPAARKTFHPCDTRCLAVVCTLATALATQPHQTQTQTSLRISSHLYKHEVGLAVSAQAGRAKTHIGMDEIRVRHAAKVNIMLALLVRSKVTPPVKLKVKSAWQSAWQSIMLSNANIQHVM